jgi:hypothetical protein
MVHPGIQFKPVEGNALFPDGDFRYPGTDLAIEAVTVHSEISGGIAQSKQAREEGSSNLCSLRHSTVPDQPSSKR